uniref:UBZ3-type domain-containing protein n=1 Tax=Anopheles maculatus TaxID=74869 RepID=A0A182SYC1_9DIPT
MERIAADALETIKRNTERFFKPNSTTALHNPVKFLGISAGKFEPNASGKGGGIRQMFQSYTSNKASSSAEEGPIGMERRKSVSETAPPPPPVDLPKAETLHEELPPMKKGKDEPVAECSEPPKGHIKHFLQHHATLAAASSAKRDERALEQSNANVAPKESETKPKKGIKQFLQPKSAICQESAPKSEAIEEKSAEASLCDTEDTESAQETESSVHEVEELDKPEEKPSTSGLGLDQTNDTHEEKSDYKETYAEYLYQVPEPEPLTLECPQCKKHIPEHEYQSHQDFHFALSLSQQQRDEFRNDLKSKITAKSPFPVKRPSKPISSASSAATSSGGGSTSSGANLSIERFLSKVSPESMRPSSSEMAVKASSKENDPSESHTKCPDCGKMIPSESMTEHNDYHVAKRLQQELNRLEAPPSQQQPPIVNKPLVAAVAGGNFSTKRKRSTIAGEEVTSPVKQKLKPVSSYFTKL